VQAKKIDPEAAAKDIRAGMDDAELMRKYNLSIKGLMMMFEKLQAKGVLQESEIRKRMPSDHTKLHIRNQFTGEVIFSAPAQTIKDLVEAAAKSHADLSEADLAGANLFELEATGADFSEALLFRANLRNSDLTGTILFRAELAQSCLSAAKLTKAELSEANLSESDLTAADLRDAVIARANLDKAARFLEANLENANLERADLRGAELVGANFTGAVLTGAKLDGANLTDAKGISVS
jgi:uncharacterized protein YjbI with pentapeptide repeats